MSNLMSGAKMLLECLVREGVDCFFGYPGGVTLPFYDALYDHHIRHMLVRHEENACFAAEGYARATGKVGVCCATSGPGATNLITGLGGFHDGFDSDRGDHRTGFDQADRQRRISGSRHVRHHALLHQAQFHGEERWRSFRRSCTKRSISPRAGGRDRCWWMFRRTFFRRRAITLRSPAFIFRVTKFSPKATPARLSARRR